VCSWPEALYVLVAVVAVVAIVWSVRIQAKFSETIRSQHPLTWLALTSRKPGFGDEGDQQENAAYRFWLSGEYRSLSDCELNRLACRAKFVTGIVILSFIVVAVLESREPKVSVLSCIKL